MADSPKKLSIPIETPADLTGLKQTGQGLTELGEKTKAYTKIQEDSSKSEEKGNLSKGETRRAIREIGRELPILGELGRMVMEPLIGAFVLLAAAVRGAFDGIKELGDRSTPEFKGLTEAITEQKEAMDELELSAQAYDRALERIGNARETATEQSKAALEKIKDHGGKELELTDKKHDLASSSLEEAEKLGLVTHEQYIAKKLALDEQYAQARLKIEKQVAMAEQVQKHAEYQNLYADSADIESGLAVKRAAAAKAAGAAKFTAGKGQTDAENLKATEDKIKELEKEAAELHEKTTGLGAFTTLTPQVILHKQQAQNDIEQESARATADQLRRKIKQDEDAKNSTTNAANAAKEDLAAGEARLKQNRERMHTLEIELPRGDTKLREDNAQQTEIERIESATRISKAVSEVAKDKNPTGEVLDVADQIQRGQRREDTINRTSDFTESLSPSQLETAAKGAEALAHGRKVDTATKSLITSLASVLSTNHGNIKDVLDIIKKGNEGQAGLNSEIAALRRSVQQLQGRSGTPPPR